MKIRNAKLEDVSREGFYDPTCFIPTLHYIRLSKPTLRLYEWKQICVTICLNYDITRTEQFSKGSIKLKNKPSNNKMELKWGHESQNERTYRKIKKK